MIRLFNRQLNVELNGELTGKLTGKLNVKLNGEVPSNEGAFKVNWPPTIYSDNLRGNLRGVNHFQNVLTKTSLQKRFIQNIATRPFITTRLKRASVYRSKKLPLRKLNHFVIIASFESQTLNPKLSVDTVQWILRRYYSPQRSRFAIVPNDDHQIIKLKSLILAFVPLRTTSSSLERRLTHGFQI